MFYDSNVLIDILSRDPRWFSWSAERVAEADGGGIVNMIVMAELASGYGSLEELEAVIDPLDLKIAEIDTASAFQAGHAFAAWRRWRDVAASPRVLPDFLIGAHASSLSLPLVTRDPALYRRYFPDLPLITPDTHP